MSKDELEKYQRGATWWVRGRLPGEKQYLRESLGTSDEAIAEAKIREIQREARKRAILGPDAPKPQDELTFSGAVLLFDAKPRDAIYLAKVIKRIGDHLVRDITAQTIKRLAKKMYPAASTDTWHRQVVVPVRSVINAAHEAGLCPPIRVKAYTKVERMNQDRARGKNSRVARAPGSWEWLMAFREHADPRLGAMALFMFTTGARISQTLAMRNPRDMDLSHFRLFLPAAKGHPAQWVEVLPMVAIDVANLPAPKGKLASKRVFGYAGQRSGWLYRAWRKACDDAGIEYLSPHAAGRHGFGTEMIVRMKVDAATAAQAGRWASAKVLLDTYSHADGSGDRVRAAFADGLAAARTNPVQAKAGNVGKAAGNKGSSNG